MSVTLIRRFPWMSKAIAFLLVLLGSGAAAWQLGIATSRNPAARPVLVVLEGRLNLGLVWEDAAFRWVLPVDNQGEREIDIVGFASSCSCSSIVPQTLHLAPGERAQVTVTINLTGHVRDEDTDGRDFVEQIVPRLKGEPVSQPVWTLQGRVRRVLKLDPRRLDLRQIAASGPVASGRVRIASSVPLKDLVPSADECLAAVRVLGNVGQVSNLPEPARVKNLPHEFELHVDLEKTLESGRYHFDVTLTPNGVDGTSLPPIVLPVTATVRAEVEAVPSAVMFAARPVGQECEEYVLLRSAIGKEIEVVGIEVIGDDLVVQAGKEQPDPTERHYRVTQRIAKHRDQLNLVRFTIRTADGGTIAVPLTVSYYGIEAVRP